MKDPAKRLRLDQILLQEGLITEEQIKVALADQKERGGKFGSNLLYNKSIDEISLVKALAKQLNCRAVVLSKLTIPVKVLALIPAKLAVARKVIPFDYDLKHNVIKIACEDPNDQKLLQELQFVIGHDNIELYLSPVLVINTSIAKHYLDYDTDKLDNYLLELPKIYGLVTEEKTEKETSDTVQENEEKERILLVSDEEKTRQLLGELFEADGYIVHTAESADDALEILDAETYHSVFIRDTVSGDYLDLIDRLRKLSPRTHVRYYESVSSLIMNLNSVRNITDLLKQNLDLFSSLLTDKEKMKYNHDMLVGKYVNMLCDRLGLPGKDSHAVINAAYLHDISKFYYSGKAEQSDDVKSPINSSIKLLESLNFSPVIIEILRSMYKDLNQRYTKRLPIEILGGNIITICDLFCKNIDVNERLSLDTFDSIKKKINDMTGQLFLAEVAEAFIELIEEDILTESESETYNQVMIYSRNQFAIAEIINRLKTENFRVITVDSPEDINELYQRGQPDFILLNIPGTPDEIKLEVENIRTLSLDFNNSPTYVLTDAGNTSELTSILELGIEDILSNEGNIELLITKLRKIQSGLSENSEQIDQPEPISETHGKLSDHDLIDLIQMIGEAAQTVRLTVVEDDNELNPLVIYLKNGWIIHAQMGEYLGPEAVYKSIGWKEGFWDILTVDDDDLPEQNNNLPNESILMEGCRLLDETKGVNQRV